MTDGIIQRVFDWKTKYMPDYYIHFVLEELKNELLVEIEKELASQLFRKSYEFSMFKQWLIGD